MDKSTQSFDDKLNQAFLELDFEQAENQSVLHAFSTSILSSKTPFLSKFGKWTFLSIFVIVGLFMVIFYHNISIQEERKTTSLTDKPTKQKKIQELEVLQSASYHTLNNEAKTPKPLKAKMNSFPLSSDSLFSEKEEKRQKVKVYQGGEVIEIPSLTPEQIKAHQKRKADFLKELLKLKKKKFYDFNYSAKGSAYNLVVWKTEISNAEYQLFINDLLVKQDAKTYLKAKVDPERWTEAFSESYMEPMKDLYHWHPAYENFPVVNISASGANLFCNWLSEEISKHEKNKNDLKKVRLMTYDEWKYIYTSGYTQMPYPWGGPYLRNKEGCFLANYKPMKNNFVADGGLQTVKVDAYGISNFELFNLAGNAAEWVELDGGKYTAVGGSWADVAEKLRYDAAINDTLKESHPTIGFRPVIEMK